MELSRRKFLAFMSAAPAILAFDPHRTIFDMGRSKIWTPPPVEIIPVKATTWLELGGYVDRSIAMTLAKFGVEQNVEIITPDYQLVELVRSAENFNDNFKWRT
jgi:hypothetical protein